MKKQAGFGVLEVIVVLVILLAVGGVGYFMYSCSKSSDAKANASGISEQASNTGATKKEGSLYINEWGVKLKNAVADKLTYAYNHTPGKDIHGGDDYESIAILGFKESALHNIGCDPSTSLLRSKVQPKVADVVQLGDYYYWSYGEPSNCDEGSDVQLAQDFTNSFNLSKLELQQ